MALYDPREFPETTVGTDFTLADVLAWARTKPADEVYCYTDPGNCAICQFLHETGRVNEPRVVLNRWRDGLGSKVWHEFDARISGAANWATIKPDSFDGTATFSEFADLLDEKLAA